MRFILVVNTSADGCFTLKNKIGVNRNAVIYCTARGNRVERREKNAGQA